jgi:hypothetical protein
MRMARCNDVQGSLAVDHRAPHNAVVEVGRSQQLLVDWKNREIEQATTAMAQAVATDQTCYDAGMEAALLVKRFWWDASIWRRVRCVDAIARRPCLQLGFSDIMATLSAAVRQEREAWGSRRAPDGAGASAMPATASSPNHGRALDHGRPLRVAKVNR